MIPHHLGDVELTLELGQRARHSFPRQFDVAPDVSRCFNHSLSSLSVVTVSVGASCDGARSDMPRRARTTAITPAITSTTSAPSQYWSAGSHWSPINRTIPATTESDPSNPITAPVATNAVPFPMPLAICESSTLASLASPRTSDALPSARSRSNIPRLRRLLRPSNVIAVSYLLLRKALPMR